MRLVALSGYTLDLTWQNIITHAEVRLETLVRLYYLRHSFEAYDPLLMHWLMFLGDAILQKLDGTGGTPTTAMAMTPTNFESLRSTLILCAKGLYDQKRNYHIAAIVFRLLRDRMKANDVDLLRTHIFSTPSPSSSSASGGDDDTPLMMQYVQAQWLAPIVTKPDGDSNDVTRRSLDYLLREYEKLSLNDRAVEDVSEVSSPAEPPSPRA